MNLTFNFVWTEVRLKSNNTSHQVDNSYNILMLWWKQIIATIHSWVWIKTNHCKDTQLSLDENKSLQRYTVEFEWKQIIAKIHSSVWMKTNHCNDTQLSLDKNKSLQRYPVEFDFGWKQIIATIHSWVWMKTNHCKDTQLSLDENKSLQAMRDSCLGRCKSR